MRGRPTKYTPELVKKAEGFGLYSTFIHIDTRSGKPARWGDA